MLKALALWIADRCGLTIDPATGNFWAGPFPDTGPDEAHALQETAIDLTDPETGKKTKGFNVVTRGRDYHKAREAAEAIHDSLLGVNHMTGIQLSAGWFVYTVTGGGPRYTGPDSRQRHQFVTDLMVRATKET